MIAFGCSVSESEPYFRYAEPGIRMAAEPDSAAKATTAPAAISADRARRCHRTPTAGSEAST